MIEYIQWHWSRLNKYDKSAIQCFLIMFSIIAIAFLTMIYRIGLNGNSTSFSSIQIPLFTENNAKLLIASILAGASVFCNKHIFRNDKL